MIAKSIKPLDTDRILEAVQPAAGPATPAVYRKHLDRLLVVEDNPGDARLLQVLFDEQGSSRTKVTHVECLRDAESFLAGNPVDIILLDLGLPDAQGLEAVRRIHVAAPNVPLVVLTGLDDETVATQALQEGAQDYLVKGQIETRGLLRALRYSVERKVLEEALLAERALVHDALQADIAARKIAQHALEAAQRRLDHVVSSSPMVLFLVKFAGGSIVLDWVSRNVERLVECEHEAIDPAWWVGRLHPHDRDRVLGELRAAVGTGGARLNIEYRFLKCDDTYEWMGTELCLLRDDDGGPVEAVGSWASIAARKETEQRMQESEEHYRVLFESIPHPMFVFDNATFGFLSVNDAAVAHYGYSRAEFLAMTVKDLRRPEDVPAFLAMLEKAETERPATSNYGVHPHRRKNGTVVQMDISSNRIRLRDHEAWLTLALDVTGKRDLESQLLQSQKMDSIGRLAGGVAHDFNNILGVITGYGELLGRRVTAEPRLRKYADDIVKAAERGAGLTRQLLAFSRKQVLQPRVLDLNVVVGDMERMLRRVIGEDIQLATIFDDDLGAVEADPGQMEQVLMNLAVNARDAMARGGQITIETANVVLDDAYSRVRPGVLPGPYVMMSMSDTGQGMTKEVLARAFEPFYTTKDAGKGTGLGLATVHGIVKQSGGHIWAYSEPGRGTNFKIYLPRVDSVLEEGGAAAVAVEPPRGLETVLLVEDEESLREIIRECLEDSGYTVIDAADGEGAIAACAAHRGDIHLLITDVVMPGIGGREVAERLKAERPLLRAIYMSGYTDDAVVLHGVLADDMAFLQKPFTSLALATKVRQVLDAAREPAAGSAGTSRSTAASDPGAASR